MTAPANARTCYRHPDQVAGIVCQRCDRPICPSCMHQASVGFHCPECTKQGAQKVYRGVASLATKPIVTQVLIAINVAVFVLGIILGGSDAVRGTGTSLVTDGGLFGPLVPDEPYRLLTSGFLHGGLLHLGFNMWVLWVLGKFMEPTLGRVRFLALYFTALFAGSLGVVLLDPLALTVGASGAIFGLMGGALLVARERNIDLRSSGLVTVLVINLLITFTIPNISIGGHLGGLVGGVAAAFVLTEGARRMGPKGDLIAAGLTAALGVGCAVVAYTYMGVEYGLPG